MRKADKSLKEFIKSLIHLENIRYVMLSYAFDKMNLDEFSEYTEKRKYLRNKRLEKLRENIN